MIFIGTYRKDHKWNELSIEIIEADSEGRAMELLKENATGYNKYTANFQIKPMIIDHKNVQ